MEKTCRKCGIKATHEKEIREKFHKDSSKSYGYENICGKCKNLLSAEYRKSKKITLTDKDRDILIEVLNSEAKPNAALEKAMENHKKYKHKYPI